MIRKIAEFYLIAMGLAFSFTIWLGSSGAYVTEVFIGAMMAWPLAFLLMLARGRIKAIQARVRD